MTRRLKKAALQAATLLSAGIILLPLSACGQKEKPAGSPDASMSGSSGIFSFQNISMIRITDTKAGRYQDAIDFFLTEEETEKLSSMIENGSAFSAGTTDGGASSGEGLSAGQPRMGDYYSMHLIDSDGQEAAVWIIDLSHVVIDEEGNVLQPAPAMKKYLKDIEAAYGLTYSSVMDRLPGPEYFSDLQSANMVILEEMPDQDRTDLVRYSFTEDEISAMIEKLDGMLASVDMGSAVQPGSDVRWKLSLYDDGRQLYEFERDSQGFVYENGFKVNDKDLEAFYEEVLDTYCVK